MVPQSGVEPESQSSQDWVLSIERLGHRKSLYSKAIVKASKKAEWKFAIFKKTNILYSVYFIPYKNKKWQKKQKKQKLRK